MFVLQLAEHCRKILCFSLHSFCKSPFLALSEISAEHPKASTFQDQLTLLRI